MDPPEFNKKFAEEHSFGYPLISNGEEVIRRDGTLEDFIDPFDADQGPEDLLKRLAAGAPPREPGRERAARRRRKKKGMLRGLNTFHHSGEHRRIEVGPARDPGQFPSRNVRV